MLCVILRGKDRDALRSALRVAEMLPPSNRLSGCFLCLCVITVVCFIDVMCLCDNGLCIMDAGLLYKHIGGEKKR